MQNKNINKIINYLLIFFVVTILLLVFFVFTLKSQANKDLQTLIGNQNITTALNSKFIEEYKNNEPNLKGEINNTYNPLDLTKTITKIFNINNNVVSTYRDEIVTIRKEFSSSLEAWKSGITQDPNFESKDAILGEINTLASNVDKILEYKDLESQKAVFEDIQKKYKTQLDSYSKKAFIAGIKSSQGEINDLINYLKQYPSLGDAASTVEKYNSELNVISQDSEITKYSFVELENKVNKDIKPLLAQGIRAKSDNEELLRIKSAAISPTALSATNNDIPITRGKLILVKKGEQRMYIYNDGVLLRDTSVTTGRINWPTDTGTFSILTKERSRRLQGSGQGATWNVFVNYWMLFNAVEEEGIHDASWRNGIFGNPLSDTNGSRGCINTPDDTIGWLFDWAPIGTPVVILD